MSDPSSSVPQGKIETVGVYRMDSLDRVVVRCPECLTDRACEGAYWLSEGGAWAWKILPHEHEVTARLLRIGQISPKEAMGMRLKREQCPGSGFVAYRGKGPGNEKEEEDG